MSSNDPRKFLFDTIDAANDIKAFVEGMTLEDYRSNTQVKAAVERKFEIIGEALNRIKRESPELLRSITGHKKIITFRNILAHGYDIVSDPIVWDIIESNLGLLLEETKAILTAMD